MDAAFSQSEDGVPSVLVVEDDLLLGARIAAVLSDLHFTVIGIASTASEALSLVRMSRPHLALVDVGLAGRMDAVRLARALNRVGIPTIFLGEARDPEASRRAQATRTMTYLTAPFRPSVTYNAILSVLVPARREPDTGPSASAGTIPAALCPTVRTASAIE